MKEKKEIKKRLWEDEAEMLQDYYDALPDDLKVKVGKPKGYHAPDMDFPRKNRKPRNRKAKWQKGKINA